MGNSNNSDLALKEHQCRDMAERVKKGADYFDCDEYYVSFVSATTYKTLTRGGDPKNRVFDFKCKKDAQLLAQTLIILSKDHTVNRTVRLNAYRLDVIKYVEWAKTFKHLVNELCRDITAFESLLELMDIVISDASTYQSICKLITYNKVIKLNLSILESSNRYYPLVPRNCDYTLLRDAIQSTNSLRSITLGTTPCEKTLQAILESIETNWTLQYIMVRYKSCSYLWGVDISHTSEIDEGWKALIEDKFSELPQLWKKCRERNNKISSYNDIICVDINNKLRLSKFDNWNNNKCKLNTARYVLENEFKLDDKYFNHDRDMCYCLKCHKERNDYDVYARGNPPSKYELPIGWVRFAIDLKQVQGLDNIKIDDIFKEWHVSYHGTKKDTVSKIFSTNCQLLLPGDKIPGTNKRLEIRDKHINTILTRPNEYTKQEERFDPKCIFTSPTMIYSSLPQYCSFSKFTLPDGTKIKAQFAFQCRQKPNSYKIGQETVGAKKDNIKFSKHFKNGQVEWYTQQKECIVLYGLLIKVQIDDE